MARARPVTRIFFVSRSTFLLARDEGDDVVDTSSARTPPAAGAGDGWTRSSSRYARRSVLSGFSETANPVVVHWDGAMKPCSRVGGAGHEAPRHAASLMPGIRIGTSGS